MKIDIKSVIITALVLLAIYLWARKVDPEIQTVTITVPEIIKTTDTIKLEPLPPIIKYVKGDTKYVADSTYYEMYLKANDSLEKLNLYLDAITIRDYKQMIVDNDTISIEVNSKTRGYLLSQFATYNIKERTIEYEPKSIIQMPKFRLLGGVEANVPTIVGEKFSVSGNLMFQSKNANLIKVGYSTNEMFSIGYYKSIFKIK